MYMSFLEFENGKIEGIRIHWNKQEAYENFPFGLNKDGYGEREFSFYTNEPYRVRLIKIDENITETLEVCVKLALGEQKLEYLGYELEDHDYDWDESEYIKEE